MCRASTQCAGAAPTPDAASHLMPSAESDVREFETAKYDCKSGARCVGVVLTGRIGEVFKGDSCPLR